MLVVSCFYWRDETRDGRGYTFRDEHVRILKRMVERNLTIPHKFVCVTDQEIDGIECVPIDWAKHVPGTVFVRLMQHRRDYGRLIGASRVMNLDIDMVVTGNIDHLASRPEPSVWFRNPGFPLPRRAFYQSSFQLFTPGTHPELHEEFDPNDEEFLKGINWRFGGHEQAWISERLPWDLPYVDDRDGVYGAGRIIGGYDNTAISVLPKNACLVTFPGHRMVDQPDVQRRFPWIAEHWK